MTIRYRKTRVILCQDERELGQTAASDVARSMRRRLAKHERIRIIFAAGESQMTFLDALAEESGLD